MHVDTTTLSQPNTQLYQTQPSVTTQRPSRLIIISGNSGTMSLETVQVYQLFPTTSIYNSPPPKTYSNPPPQRHSPKAPYLILPPLFKSRNIPVNPPGCLTDHSPPIPFTTPIIFPQHSSPPSTHTPQTFPHNTSPLSPFTLPKYPFKLTNKPPGSSPS